MSAPGYMASLTELVEIFQRRYFLMAKNNSGHDSALYVTVPGAGPMEEIETEPEMKN